MRKERITGKDIIKAGIVFKLLFCMVCIPFYGIRDEGYHYSADGFLMDNRKQPECAGMVR